MSFYRPTSAPPPRGGGGGGGSGPPQYQQALQGPPGGLSNMYANPMQMQQPQLGFMNPQLSNPYNSNNNGFNMNMGSFQGLPQQFQSQGGFCPQNTGPVLGQFGGWQQNQGQNIGGVMLNPAQVAALNQFVGCVAQSMVPQNAGFLGNPQLGLVQPNAGLQQQPQQQGSFGQQQPQQQAQQQGSFGQQLPVVSQQFQNAPMMPWNPSLAQQQNNPSWNPQNQGNHGKQQGVQSNTGHNQNKKFMKNPQRDASNRRSKKSNAHQVHNTKMKLQSSNMNEGKGVERADHQNSAIQSKSEKRRPLFLLYTKKEIEKWRQDRKKNYPTTDNVQKKLSPKQANIGGDDEEAKLRRQQLKEVIAKQVELGFEVPEIPAHYMLDMENQCHEKGRKRRPLKGGRDRNRFNKRRPAWQRSTEGHEQEQEDKGTSACREPTLLQKLLRTDVKRDKNRLLQAFRFMTLNSFFMDQTDERLCFPQVVVEEEGEITD